MVAGEATPFASSRTCHPFASGEIGWQGYDQGPGRALGDETFVGRLEEMLGRALKPQKGGPKAKHRAN